MKFLKGFSFVLFILSMFFSVGCKDDSDLNDVVEKNIQKQSISVTEEGYLHFNSQLTFDDYIKSLKNEEHSGLRSAKVANINGFTSLNQLKDEMQSSSLRSGTISDDGEIEEGSMEEYQLAKCAGILHDDLIMNVLDTTLRISVGEKYYKITESGTFCGDIKDAEKVNEYASNYEKYKNLFISQSGEAVSYDGILFQPMVKEIIEETTSLKSLVILNKNTSEVDIVEEKSIKYNLDSYTVNLKPFYGFIGFDIEREAKIDKSHRVQLNVFHLNLLFYTQSGINLALQKKKSILWGAITYWVEDKAEDRVLGFHDFEGIMSLTNPVPPITQETYRDPKYSNLSAVTAPIAGYLVNIAVGNFISAPLINERMTNIQSYFVYGLAEHTPLNKTQSNKIADASFGAAINAIRNAGKKGLTKLIPNDQLSVIEHPFWDGKTIKYAWFGESSHGAGKTKKVLFNRSFGISIKFGSSLKIGGFTPTKFSIKKADFYGAVKYKGKWRGVRIH